MKQRNQDARNGRPRGRLGTRAVALVGAIALVASMCPGTAALAFANVQLTTGAVGLEAQMLSAQGEDVRELTSAIGWLSAGTWIVPEGKTVDLGWYKRDTNALKVAPGATVHLIIEKNAVLKARGGNAVGSGVGRAAILLPESSTLIVSGEGKLIATGGNAGNGEQGHGAGGSVFVSHNGGPKLAYTGNGGSGGKGGGGAGAGIGTDGGAGGAGGAGGSGVEQAATKANTYGNPGKPGGSGSYADSAGTLIVTGSVTVNAKGGSGGSGGGSGKRGNYYDGDGRGDWEAYASGTSGGGGGGGGGSAADGIGSGGTGGGGGGGGASGNIDGECAFFGECDLDDLWGHGGSGGTSAWGGGSGAKGDEGASNGGDDTDASKKYAKAGGAGGSCPMPKIAPFYTYNYSGEGTSTLGYEGGTVRHGTPLGSLSAFKGAGGIEVAYDGKAHSAPVGALSTQSDNASALGTQAEGDDEEWPDEGTVEVDGLDVAYKVVYYDAATGKVLGGAPSDPGEYVAVVSFTGPEGYPDYTGDWVVPISIAKAQVAAPVPEALTFECADWETGEGRMQDAFPKLDESVYEFVEAEKTVDGETVASAKSAKEAGYYEACFRLKDAKLYEWADGSDGSAEIWVPWSIALAEFDPNSAEIAHWGTASGNTTTAVAYTGEPVWVRPWFALADDGEFPTWFTNWKSGSQPYTDDSTAVVAYIKGEGDYEGLVGYHTNADGSLEKVTAAQVYAWLCGVDVDGEHVDVKSGDKVWYRVDPNDQVVILAVQDAEFDGADGCIVARDLAYVDRPGVMEAGTYQAYAIFGEGAGFAAVAPAEATVTVGAADISKVKVTLSASKYTYTGAYKKPVPSVVLGGTTLKAGTDYTVKYSSNKNAGTATVTVTGKGNYKGTKTAKFTIKKAANTLTVKTATKSVKAAKAAKKAQTVKPITKAATKYKATLTYAKATTAAAKKLNGYKNGTLTVNKKTGKVTVKKGTKPGTYKLKVNVKAAATTNTKAVTKTVTVTVKVAK